MKEPTAEEIAALQKEFEEDARERAKEIEKAEQHDAMLHEQMAAGEYGVSHGVDNVVGGLLAGFALLSAVGLVWMTFATPHI